MAPKSNLGKLAALLSAVLVSICIGAGYVVLASAGTLNHPAKESNGAQPANEPDQSHWASVLPVNSEMPPAIFVPAQFRDPKDLAVGKLLVASQNLDDPNFAKTVILLVHSDDHDVVGLILNRRTNLTLSRVLEGVPGAKDRSDPVYLGGPVEVPTVMALLQSPKKVEGADHIFSGVYLISTKTLLEKTLAARPDAQVFHAYLGYAGWTSDQLRKEVELGAWFILPADTPAVFDPDPGSLWPQMIQKTVQIIARNEPASKEWKSR